MRLPTLISSQPFDTNRGTMPNPTIDDSIGTGLRSIGGALSGLATVLKNRQDTFDAFQTEAAFIRFTGEQDQRMLDRTDQITPGGVGFAATTVADFSTAAQQFITTVPEQLQQEYTLRLLEMQNNYLDSAARVEYTERNRYVTETVGQTGTQVANRVMMSPTDVMNGIAEIDALIDRSGLPPVEAETLRQNWRQQLIDASIMGQINQNPDQAYIDLGGTVPPDNLALGLRPDARSAVQEASVATGINPNYLAMTLGAESGGAAFTLPTRSVQPAGTVYTEQNFQSQYYQADQLASHDGAGLRIDANAVAALDNMTTILGGTPLTITSGYRSPQHNEAVDGATNSQHLHGTAFDIQLPTDPNERRRILAAAMQAGFTGFGFYAETPNMLHIDTRGSLAVWYWGGNGQTTPEWAAPLWNEFVRTRGAVDNVVVNENSTARGPGQFIDETWLSMMRENGPRYGLNVEGMSDNDILALRDDMRWSTLMTAEYAADNRAYLQDRLGRDVTMPEIYMAHFLGPSGALSLIQMVRSNPDARAAPIFEEAAAANHSVFYEGDRPRTVQEVYNEVVRRFEAQGSANQQPQGQMNSLYTELPYDRISAYQDQAIHAINDRQAQATRAEAARLQEQNAAYTARTASVERRIYEDPNYGHAQLRGEGLQDDDYVRLARQIDARDAKDADLRDAMVRFQDTTSQYSPFVPEDRDSVDTVWQAFDQNGEALRGMTQEGADALNEMVRRTGIVPESAAASLITMSRSGDAAQMGYALTLGGRIMEDYPDAFNGTPGSEDLGADIMRWQSLTQTQGMDYAAAAARMIEDRLPMSRERIAALSEQADTFVGEIDINQVQQYFDNKYGDVFGVPDAGFTPDAQTVILTEFRTLAREAYLHGAYGDPEVAMRMAEAQMDRLYGVTRIFGSPTIMRHPPEMTYGQIGGSMDYFTQQLQAEVETYFEQEIALEDIVLYTYPQTNRDIQAGQNPRYAVGAYTLDEATGQRTFNWMYAAFVPDRTYAQAVWDMAAQTNLRANNQASVWNSTFFQNMSEQERQAFAAALARDPTAGGDIPMPATINYVPFELQQRRAAALGTSLMTGNQFPAIQLTAPAGGAPVPGPVTVPNRGVITDMPRDYTQQPRYTPYVREVEPLDRGYDLVMPGQQVPGQRVQPGTPPILQAPPPVYGGLDANPDTPDSVPENVEPPPVPEPVPADAPVPQTLLPGNVRGVNDLTLDVIQRAVEFIRAEGTYEGPTVMDAALSRIAEQLGVTPEQVQQRIREIYEGR